MKEIAGKQRQPAWFGLDRRYGGKVEAYVGRRAAEFEPAAFIWPMRIVRHDEIERGRDYAFRVDMRDVKIAASGQPNRPGSGKSEPGIAVAQERMFGIRIGQALSIALDRAFDSLAQFRENRLGTIEQASPRLRSSPQRLAEREGRALVQIAQDRDGAFDQIVGPAKGERSYRFVGTIEPVRLRIVR